MNQVYGKYQINITPGMAFHATVPANGVLQGIWTLHCLISVFRRVPAGVAIMNPPVLNSTFFIFYNVGTLFSVGWLFLFDRILLFESAIMENLVAMSFFPAFCIASSRLFFYRKELSRSKRYSDMFVYKWCLLNGVAMQWTYAILSMTLNVAMVASMALATPPAVELASNISLGLFSILMLTYTVVDVTVMQPVFRGVISPYLVVLWSLGNILAKNWNPSNLSTIMSIALMAATSLSLILKTAISLYRVQKSKLVFKKKRAEWDQILMAAQF